MGGAPGNGQAPPHMGGGYGQPPQQAQMEMNAGSNAPLTIEMLTSATPEQQKQMLGEKLYPQIAEQQPALAGKITGMLLEMENPDILHLLENPDALTEQIDEAMNVLRAHAAAAPGEAGQSQAV